MSQQDVEGWEAPRREGRSVEPGGEAGPPVNGHAGLSESSGTYALLRDGGQVRLQRLRGAAERRRDRRVPWQHHELQPPLLEVEEPGRGWRRVGCTLVDLAAGGVGLLVAEPLDPGLRVRVTFPLPSRLDQEPGPAEPPNPAPWSAFAEIVHARHLPERAHSHVPPEAHHPYFRGVRFGQLEDLSRLRLLRALYGPLPAGWAVEQYQVRRRPGAAGGAGSAAGATRYAVVRGGKRLAWGFGSYERARNRAMSMHMDEVALASRRRERPA
jgi:hypothetical protein